MSETKSNLILRLLAEAQCSNNVSASVIDALEFQREQYGLTKSEWAAVIGLSASRYSETLSGKRRLTLNATKRAFAVGVPAEVLLQVIRNVSKTDSGKVND